MKYIIFISIFLISTNFACKPQTIETKKNKPDEKNIFKIELNKKDSVQFKKVKDIPVPVGYIRNDYKENSFGYYLQNLPLKTENNIVYLYNGYEKGNQSAHFAILKIDVGTQDLQQCADAVMRLKAEFLYQQKKYSEIHFNFLSDGKPRYYSNYAKGDYSYATYRKYMNYIFLYANTASLKKELNKVDNVNEIKIGDVFIQTGNPYGHAVIVTDIAENQNGEKIFLLSQSYMPAQEIHILKNLSNEKISPWYKINETDKLYTPEWTFKWEDLMKF